MEVNMNGHYYGEERPPKNCPYCGTVCDADFVDVGVGMIQCGPYYCQNCGASEIGPYDEERSLSEEERSCGWYAPGSEPGSSANVIDGKVVNHRVAKETYRQHFEGNPLWHDEEYVREWWDSHRSPWR